MPSQELEIQLRLDDKASGKLSQSLQRVRGATDSAEKSTSNFTRAFQGLFTAFAAFQAARFVVNATKEFAAFEKGLKNVEVLLNSNIAPTMAGFKKDIEGLSVEFGVMSASLNKSMFDIVSATGDAANAMSVLREATQLAVAGGSDLESTTSGLLTLLDSYGGSLNGAADAADLLFVAQKKARATIGELALTSGRFIPIANEMGASAEEVFSVFSLMTVALGDVNRSATNTAAILSAFQKPTKEMIQLFKESGTGVIPQNAIAQLGLAKALGIVAGASDSVKARVVESREALLGLAAVTKDINKIQEVSIELTNRQGASFAAASSQMETTAKKIEQLDANFKLLQTRIGEIVVDLGVLEAALFAIDLVTGRVKSKQEILNEAFQNGDDVMRDSMITLQALIEKRNEMQSKFDAGFIGGAQAKKNIDDLNAKIQEVMDGISERRRMLTDQNQQAATQELAITVSKNQAIIEDAILTNEQLALIDQEQTQSKLREVEMFKAMYGEMVNEISGMNMTMTEKFTEDLQRIQGQVKQMTSTFNQGFTTAISNLITGTGKASDVFKQLGQTMVQAIADFIAQQIVAATIGKAIKAAETAILTTMGATIAAAWAPAAAMVSLATLGANAAPASAGIISTTALAQGLAIPKAAQFGFDGVVSKPTTFLAGEAGAPERVTVTPLGSGVSDGGGGSTINIYIQGSEVAGGSSQEIANELGFIIEQRLRT